jgi:hypothetical protein
MFFNIYICSCSRVLLLLLLSTQCLLGQGTEYNPIKTDSARAYWQVKTLASSRSTRIQFFSAEHRLIYEEVLPGKYFKLTPYNQAVLDSTLQKVMNRQLLTSSLKTRVLKTALPIQKEYILTAATQSISFVKDYKALGGKILLLLNNPGRHFIYVTLTCPGTEYCYSNKVRPPKNSKTIYTQVVNVNRLSAGEYQLTLRQKKQQVTYQLRVQASSDQDQLGIIISEQ